MEDLIYNQQKIPKSQWRYGFRSSAATGCGWIATYNALRLMGRKAEPQKLIRYYERQLPLINGNFGTFLFGPAIYFLQKGFRIKLRFRKRRFEEAVKNSEVSILFYYWRRGWKLGAHFITVRYEDGKFVGYNTYCNSAGPDALGSHLEDFLRERNAFGAMLLALRDTK